MTEIKFTNTTPTARAHAPVSVRIIGCRQSFALRLAGTLRDLGAHAVTHDPTGREARYDLTRGGTDA